MKSVIFSFDVARNIVTVKMNKAFIISVKFLVDKVISDSKTPHYICRVIFSVKCRDKIPLQRRQKVFKVNNIGRRRR